MKPKMLLFALGISLIFLFGCTSKVTEKAEDAVEQNNPALCKELGETDDVDKCYELVADKMNDPEVCLQATDKNKCLTEFSVSKGSTKYCDMATDAAAKYSCVVQVTGDKTGRALESILADWRSKGAVSKCKELCQPSYQAGTKKCYDDFKAAQEACVAKGDYRSYCEYEASKVLDRCYLSCSDIRKDCEAGCIPSE